VSAPDKRFGVVAGIAMFAAAIALLAAVAHIPKPVLDDGLGPRMLPALVAGFLLVLAMGFTQAAWQGRVPDAANDAEEAPDPGGLQRVAWLVSGLALLFALLAWTGIWPAGAFAFVLFSRAFGSTSWPRALLIGACLTLAIWALLDQLLGVQLGGLLRLGDWRLG